MIHGENSPPSKYELSLKGKFEIWDEGESGSLERRKKKKWVWLIWNSLIYFIIIQKRKIGMLVFVQTSPVVQVVKDSPEVQETPVRFLGREKCPWEGVGYPLQYPWASLVAQWVKNLPVTQETWVLSLGWEDPLEEGKATHSSILAWRIPMDRGTRLAAVQGVASSRTRLGD